MPAVAISLLKHSGWPSFQQEVEALAKAHFAEVEGELQRHRPFELDWPVLEQMHMFGALKILEAKVDGKLAGYFTWEISLDVESKGQIIARQGAFYVDPGFQALGLGWKLAQASLGVLRDLGVRHVFPHYRMNGRGKNSGRFWKSLGAQETQVTCYLFIGER